MELLANWKTGGARCCKGGRVGNQCDWEAGAGECVKVFSPGCSFGEQRTAGAREEAGKPLGGGIGRPS